MKPFKEYLAESKKVYNFKVKVAGELPESFQENLKTALDRCKCIKLEKIKTTPIQALPLDFPTMKNCEVTVFEVICEYPITAPEIYIDVKALGLDEERFRVRGGSEPSEEEQTTQNEIINPDGLLTDSNYKEAVNVKHKDYFGDDFNKGFLKDLEKTSKQKKKEQTGPTEYKLPKGKTDKFGLKSAMGSK
jgi:hypothetical protein